MKNIVFGALVIGLFFFVSCGGDSGEDMKIDCSESTLQISEVGTTNADCGVDGSLEVSASGGIGDVDFKVGGGSSQPSGIFSVSAGTYTVTATDENGCTSSIDVTVGAEPNAVAISSATATDSGCETSNASISVIASGGTGSLTYRLDGGTFQSTNSFSGVSAGSHTVTVKNSEGCSASRSVKVLTGVSLNSDIMPLLALECAISGCHNGSDGSIPNWTVKSNVLANAANIKSQTQSGAMPQTGSISQAQKDLIACWVDDGAFDN